MSILNKYKNESALITGETGCVRNKLFFRLIESNTEEVPIRDNLLAYEWFVEYWNNTEKNAEFDFKACIK